MNNTKDLEIIYEIKKVRFKNTKNCLEIYKNSC